MILTELTCVMDKSKSIMAAEFIFYTIMCVVFVSYIVVMHFIKRNETTNRA